MLPISLLACLQRKDGEDPQRITSEEVRWIMDKVVSEARERSAGDPELFPDGVIGVTLDNLTAHKDYIKHPPDKVRATEIPSRSPDIHKVVEHPLSPFNHHWYREFTADLKCTTVRLSMQLAANILHRTTADSIKKDIDTLPATFESILRNGGDWADDALC